METIEIKMVQKQGGLYYPQVVTKEVKDISKEVAIRTCVFPRGTVMGVLMDVGNEMRRLLRQGYIVELPGIGRFYPFAHGKGSKTAEPTKEKDIDLKIVFRMKKGK